MRFPLHIRILFLLYRLLWILATPLLLRSHRLKDGAAERILRTINFSKVDLWIHAASVGEAYIAIQILQSCPNIRELDILITTNTSQGREILEKDLLKTDHSITVTYMVFDNPALVKKAVEIADPKVLVLIELEIWPALMAEMKKLRKQIIIVNGRMTEKSFAGYKKTAFLWKMLVPDTILAISEADKNRFQTLFPGKEILYVPNIKFDRLEKCQIEVKNQNKKKRLVLASIRKEEEPEVLFLITQVLTIFPELQIDLFPRHLHRVKQWEKLLNEKNISCELKSSDPEDKSHSVLIWDVFGELINAYQQADAVFVGGSLAPLGGQNFIEAFMNGAVPVTGPSVSHFLWAGEEVFENGLVKKGNNKEEVLQLLVESLKKPADKALLQQKADKYIYLRQGGSTETCQHIVELLKC
jgi:3-deoxy-D-manno-octulosonic-acid transferase